MNILLLSSHGDVAGSTMSISYLARGLASRGHDITVGCPGDTLLARLSADAGVRVAAMPFRGKFDRCTMHLIRDTVHEHRIQLINAQASRDRYLSIFAVRRYHLPVKLIHTRRQMPSSSGGRLQARFYQWGTDRIVAVSTGVGQGLVRLGIDPAHIEIIHNGTPRDKYASIDQRVVAALRHRFGISANDTVIGCVARRSKRKRQDELLRALAHIDVPTTVLFVGAVPSPRLRRLARAIEHRHRIVFTGIISPHEALACHLLLAMHVLPSTMEGLSQSLLEAMALGVPVIATRAGGNTDLIENGRNGWLFDNADTRALAECIRTVLAGGDTLKTVVGRARSTALEQFSIEKTIDGYERFFENVLCAPVAASASPLPPCHMSITPATFPIVRTIPARHERWSKNGSPRQSSGSSIGSEDERFLNKP